MLFDSKGLVATNIVYWGLIVSLALFFTPLQSVWASSYPVRGVLAGMDIDTRADSALVQTMLDESERDGESVSCPQDKPVPGADYFRGLTEAYSADVATLVLVQCLARIPKIQRSQSLFLSEWVAVQSGPDTLREAFLGASAQQYVILFVPGWAYQSNGHVTGANLEIPRQIVSAAGFENHLVPIDEFGSVTASAAIVAEQILQHGQKKLVIVSASSAGPAVAMALGMPNAKTEQVAAWLNIGGVLRGTPVVDYFRPWPKSWLLKIAGLVEGWQHSAIRSLSVQESKPRFATLVMPQHVTIVNYIGIPFSGDITPFAQKFYPILKKQGPNDGLTLITDALAPGYTIMAIGSDHFVREDPEIDNKTAALLSTVFRLIDLDEGAGQLTGM